jgi:hypothetical protein
MIASGRSTNGGTKCLQPYARYIPSNITGPACLMTVQLPRVVRHAVGVIFLFFQGSDDNNEQNLRQKHTTCQVMCLVCRAGLSLLYVRCTTIVAGSALLVRRRRSNITSFSIVANKERTVLTGPWHSKSRYCTGTSYVVCLRRLRTLFSSILSIIHLYQNSPVRRQIVVSCSSVLLFGARPIDCSDVGVLSPTACTPGAHSADRILRHATCDLQLRDPCWS